MKIGRSMPNGDRLPSLRGTKQSSALYIFWIASFLAMTASATVSFVILPFC
ncbi:MAG: hypothetical protein LBT42_06550 [Tannerella sp.]|nr:hypothetical protein [Tannerella sp.]